MVEEPGQYPSGGGFSLAKGILNIVITVMAM